MTGQLKMRQLSTATVTWLQMITVSCFSPRRIESCSADKRTFKVFHSEQSHSTDAFLSRRLPAFRCPCVRLSVCPLVWGSSNDLATFLARKSMLTNSKCFFSVPTRELDCKDGSTFEGVFWNAKKQHFDFSAFVCFQLCPSDRYLRLQTNTFQQ